MKVAFIGAGAWGVTLAQVLHDNSHQTLMYDISSEYVNKINNHKHPVFNVEIPADIKATTDLEKTINFADIIVISLPTKAIRSVLRIINPLLKTKKIFINVSKALEPETTKRVSEILYEEINNDFVEGFVALTGPSHAEDLIQRKLTLLVSASTNLVIAKQIQLLFTNDEYLRVYTSTDLIGAEVGGASKNAIAVVSGISTGLGLGENARAALITRGVIEIIKVVKLLGGREETAYGLTGLGDLIVTASSENSRNFMAGKRIGYGDTLEQIMGESKQTIEGIRTIEALQKLSVDHGVELPIINESYQVIFNNKDISAAIKSLITRDLKAE